MLQDGGDEWGVGRAVNALAFRAARPSGMDSDVDGLFDVWEQAGIDIDCDGVADFTPPGADPDRKNVYVEMDFMTNHDPDDERCFYNCIKDYIIEKDPKGRPWQQGLNL